MLVTASWPRHLRSCIGQYLMPWSLDFSWFSSGLWRTWSNYWHLRKNHQVSLYFKVIIRTNRINLPSPRSQWRKYKWEKGKICATGARWGQIYSIETDYCNPVHYFVLMTLCIGDDSRPVSLFDLVLGFISTGICPIFGILMTLPLNVLELSLKSQNNEPVFESFFWKVISSIFRYRLSVTDIQILWVWGSDFDQWDSIEWVIGSWYENPHPT